MFFVLEDSIKAALISVFYIKGTFKRPFSASTHADHVRCILFFKVSAATQTQWR